MARLEAQPHRRCIKTHTPADGIPLFADAHYLAVYRGGLDSFMSWVNHWTGMRMEHRASTSASSTDALAARRPRDRERTGAPPVAQAAACAP